VQKSKLQGDQIHKLKAELKAARESCHTAQQQQALSDKRAAEATAQLQVRGEYILLLQSQLDDADRLNAQLREQLTAGGRTSPAPPASSNGADSPAAAAGDGGAAEQPGMISCSQHDAVVQQLQQQLQMQADQIQQLRQELSNTALASPTAAVHAERAADTGSGSASTDDLASDLDTARAAPVALSLEAAVAEASALPATATTTEALHELQAQDVQRMRLQKKCDDLEMQVKQLESNGIQREALLGGLLAQVGPLPGMRMCWPTYMSCVA
jgi:hypothetical protein